MNNEFTENQVSESSAQPVKDVALRAKATRFEKSNKSCARRQASIKITTAALGAHYYLRRRGASGVLLEFKRTAIA